MFVVVDIENFLRSSKTFHQSRELTPVAQTVDFELLLTDGHAQRADDGVRPRQPWPERARAKAPADLRNCTGKTQGHLFRMK